MFCPFLKDECNQDCVFYNDGYRESSPLNCNIADAVNAIRFAAFEGTNPQECLENISSKLESIEDHTYDNKRNSSNIDDKLDDIASKLDDVKRKL